MHQRADVGSFILWLKSRPCTRSPQGFYHSAPMDTKFADVVELECVSVIDMQTVGDILQ